MNFDLFRIGSTAQSGFPDQLFVQNLSFLQLSKPPERLPNHEHLLKNQQDQTK